MPARENVLVLEPEVRLGIDLKRLAPVLMTLCSVLWSRKAKVTFEPFEIVSFFGENATFFSVTVLLAAPDAAIWPPSAAAATMTAVSRASERLFMPALAPASSRWITGWRTGDHQTVRMPDAGGMVQSE